MKAFEKFILTDFIPNHSKIEEDGKYTISLEDIMKLNLSAADKSFLLKTLKTYQIGVSKSEKKEETENDIIKGSHSKDFNYGERITEYDKPTYSEIQYETNGMTSFEDYSKLEDFLDKSFIPAVIQTKQIKDPISGDIELYAYIPLYKIIKLQLSDLEIKHTIEFLGSMDIRVTGKNITLDSEFDNYDYIITYKRQHLPETKNWDEQLEWFKEYKRTGNPQIKQKIIEANLRLVPFITRKIAYTYGIDINELNSYGYEKLIESVDMFDLSRESKFSTFAFTTIRNYIYKNLPSLLGFKHWDVYLEFMQATNSLTDLYEQNGIDKKVALEEIVDFIQNQYNYGKIKRQTICNEIATSDMENIDDFTESQKYVDDNYLEKKLLNDYSHQELKKVLDTLPNQEKIVLIHRYGLEDGIFKSQEVVGQMLHLSRTRISQIEHNAFRILKRPSRKKTLLELLESYNQMNYDESVHFKKI